MPGHLTLVFHWSRCPMFVCQHPVLLNWSHLMYACESVSTMAIDANDVSNWNLVSSQ